jgi:hypothetical protein
MRIIDPSFKTCIIYLSRFDSVEDLLEPNNYILRILHNDLFGHQLRQLYRIAFQYGLPFHVLKFPDYALIGRLGKTGDSVT